LTQSTPAGNAFTTILDCVLSNFPDRYSLADRGNRSAYTEVDTEVISSFLSMPAILAMMQGKEM